MISAGVLGVCAVAKNSHVILAFAMASYCPVLLLLAASGALSHYFKHVSMSRQVKSGHHMLT
jgi:hypothetical protein